MCCKCGNGAPTGTVPLYLNPTTGQLYYKDSSGNPVPYVPPVNAGDVPPAPSEDETPSGEYQCYKATAIAKMIERALGDMSTAISQGEVTDHVDLANDFKSVVGTDYQVNTVKALAFAKAVMPNTTTQVVVGLDYSNADALIKALACMIQYRISNEVRLSDADISAARAALSAPVAGTSMVVLQAAFDVLVPSELKNNAYLESQRGTAVCDCEGDQPAPPAPPVEPDPAKDPIPVESACNRATYVKSVKIDFEDYQPGLPVATVKNYPVAGARAGAGFSLSNIGVNQYDSPVYNASVLLHFEKNVKFLGCRMYYSHGSASSISPRFDITVQGWTDPLSNGLSLGSQFGAVPAPQQGLTTMVSSNASADISDLLLILIATCNPDTTLASPKATSLLITVQYLGINYTITVGEQFGCEEAGGVA